MPTVSFRTRGFRGAAATRSSLVSAAIALPFAEAQRRRATTVLTGWRLGDQPPAQEPRSLLRTR
jgi:hypothetical protein